MCFQQFNSTGILSLIGYYPFNMKKSESNLELEVLWNWILLQFTIIFQRFQQHQKNSMNEKKNHSCHSKKKKKKISKVMFFFLMKFYNHEPQAVVEKHGYYL